MRHKLADLSPDLLDAIVALECENMIPVLSAIGIHVTPEEIRAEILKNPEQTILTVIQSEKLVGVVRYTPDLFVRAIQLRDRAGRTVLKSLLAQAHSALANESAETVRSVAQTSNPRSIAFHERLGFTRTKENPKAIQFTIDRNTLQRALSRFRFRVRPFSEQDYEILPEIDRALDPSWKHTSDRYREADRELEPKFLKERWICEADGAPIGYGLIAHDTYHFHPKRYHARIQIIPPHQNQGAGRLLFERLEARLKSLRAISVNASIPETRHVATSFAQKMGFHEIYRNFWSTLSLENFETTPSPPPGIELRPLSELASDPDYRKKIYELETIIVKDIPLTEDRPTPPSEAYWKYVDRYCPTRESFFVALENGQYVGMHLVFPGHDPKQFFVSSTGVLPSHRRRGICTALKIAGLRYAKTHGAKEMNTFNDSKNIPVLEMNRRFGFVRRPPEVVFQKTY